MNKAINNLKQKSMGIVEGTYSCDSDFANLCTLMTTLDFFIKDEEYEQCAAIVAYINNSPELQQVKNNFTEYFEIWCVNNRIF